MKTRIAASLAALLVLGSLGVAKAEDTPGTLSPSQPLLTWSDTISEPAAVDPEASVRCFLIGCSEFAFAVSLPDGYWAANPGSVEVAIRWAPYDGETDLELYVYDGTGAEVGRSAALDSNAESVFLPSLANGRYRAVVGVATNTRAEPFAVEGMVQIEPVIAGDPEAPRELLPDLIALPPTNFHVATALNLIPQPENPLISCYPEETVEDPDHPTRCLRFNQIIGNAGDGKLELRFDAGGVGTPDTADDKMLQRIFSDDGSYRDRLADSYEFHEIHGHIHYKGFGQSFLYDYAWGEGRGAQVRQGNKVGFCVIDVYLLDAYWTATGNGPRTRTFPSCNIPRNSEAGTWMEQGIDVGWADIYGWNLADQYVDITGVADGLYEIEQQANPNGSVTELTDANNKASSVICIQGEQVRAVTTAAEAATCS